MLGGCLLACKFYAVVRCCAREGWSCLIKQQALAGAVGIVAAPVCACPFWPVSQQRKPQVGSEHRWNGLLLILCAAIQDAGCCLVQDSVAGESELTPSHAAGSSYSKVSRASRLDKELKEAMNLVKASDQKIGALRKMHAQCLLKRCVASPALLLAACRPCCIGRPTRAPWLDTLLRAGLVKGRVVTHCGSQHCRPPVLARQWN